MNLDEVNKLVSFIEENTRADKVSGIDFIDPRNFRSKVQSRQNGVVFGRRGAGKSTLLKTLENTDKIFSIYVNLEDYKDITFPNIIIKVLVRFFRVSIENLKKDNPIWKIKTYSQRIKLINKLKKEIAKLEKKTNSPDSIDESRKYKTGCEEELKNGLKNEVFELGSTLKEYNESEIEHKWKIDKLNELKTSIDEIKEIIALISEQTSKTIILILDDFYFIPKSIQPYLVDYFHRLTKSNNFYLKIGTVKHRTRLYKQSDESYIGMELNADIYDVDLDYTLDKWSDLKRFKRDLLAASIRLSKANIEIDEIFNEESFEQLCLASGGVPRDFLVLFIKCCATLNENSTKINVPTVREVAIQNYVNKKVALEKDSLISANILEKIINYLRDKVFVEKRTNVFLIDNEVLERDEEIKNLVRELIDLRFLHIIDNNTSSAPSDGKRYSAYLLDVSLYTNGRPRNFKEVKPDLKIQRDDIRSSPRILVENLRVLIH
jgi:hypothetical protein